MPSALFLASLFYILCQFRASLHTSSGDHIAAEAVFNISLNITGRINDPKVFDYRFVTKVWLILPIVRDVFDTL